LKSLVYPLNRPREIDTLIAGLERARDGALALDQVAAWTPVLVRRVDGREVDPVGEASV